MIIRQKQVLTPTLAEFCFRVHWQMLAEIGNSPDKYNHKVAFAEILAEHFNLRDFKCSCFLCELLIETYGSISCAYCPVVWSEEVEKKVSCTYIFSLYSHWQEADTFFKAKFYARKIAALPFNLKLEKVIND
jgi:hypothetical protein